MYNIDLISLSAESCPQEVIIARLVKSLINSLPHTVPLAQECPTVTVGTVRNSAMKENLVIGALPQEDTLRSV